MNQIGIVVALPNELRTLTKRDIPIGSWERISDYLLVAVSGIGPDRATAAARMLLANGANVLLSWGCAAGLDKHLKAGNLVIPKQIMSSDGSRIQTDRGWHRRVCELLSEKVDVVNTGVLAESRYLAATIDEKMALGRKSKAVAADMESAALSDLANQMQVPFVAIRAIADPLNMPLPKAVSQSLDEKGNANILRLLQYLIVHPWEIGALIRLGIQFRAAQNTLSKVAVLLNHDLLLSAE